MEESQALGVGAILLDLHIFGRDVKAKKTRGVPQVAESVYSTKLKKKIPYTSPATDGLSQKPVESQEVHPTSSVMDHTLKHISRIPTSSRGEEQIAVVEGKNRPWNVPGGPGIKGQPSSAESVGTIPGGRTEIPHALKQLSSMLQLLSPQALDP